MSGVMRSASAEVTAAMASPSIWWKFLRYSFAPSVVRRTKRWGAKAVADIIQTRFQKLLDSSRAECKLHLLFLFSRDKLRPLADKRVSSMARSVSVAKTYALRAINHF